MGHRHHRDREYSSRPEADRTATSARGRGVAPPPQARGRYDGGQDMGGSAWSGPSGRGGREHAQHPADRIYDRDADMGGSGWSGASGRGGMSYREGAGGGRGDGRDRWGAPGARAVETRTAARDYSGRGFSGSDFAGDEGGSPDSRGPRALGHGGNATSNYGGHAGAREGGSEERYGRAEPYGREGYDRGETTYGREGHDRGAYGREGYDRGETYGREGYGRGETYGHEEHGRDASRMGPSGAGSQGARGWPATDMGIGMRARESENEAFHVTDAARRGPHYGKGPKNYTRTDDRIREDVCEAIAHQGQIDASDVDVKVERGVVILTGTVAQRHHKRALEHLIEHCRGVTDVRNELRPEAAGSRQGPRESATQTEGQSPPSAFGNGTSNNKTARA